MAPPNRGKKEQVVMPLVAIPNCPQEKAPLPPNEYGPIVTLVVGNGETQREFHVYKSLLEHQSSYFRTALKPTWKEGATRVVKLPEDDPDIFAIFFHWIFTGKLYPKLTAKGKVPLSFLEAFRVYVFSDARGIPALGNASINLIFQKSFQDWKCPTDHLQYVYENTLPGSGLREFIVDDALECYNFTKLAEEPELFTKDFLVEVLLLENERTVPWAALSSGSCDIYQGEKG